MKWFVVVVALGLVAGAVIIFCFSKKNGDDSNVMEDVELYKDNCEFDNWESAEELFCHFLSVESWPQDSFFYDMVEVYNAYVLTNGINSIIDEWCRYETSEEALEAIRQIDVGVLHDNDIKEMVSRCVDLGQQYFADCTGEEEFRNNLYFTDSVLSVRYSIYTHVDFSEEKYWEELSFMGKVEYDLFKGVQVEKVTAENLNTKKVQEDIELLLGRINTETDFDRKCMYAMAYVYHVGFWRTDFKIIESLLDDGRFSPQLFFLWRIWRCGVQLGNSCYGPSTWSVIPNIIYNEKRRKIAESTLRYLVDHRDDAVAINQFLMTASLPNNLRKGEYPLGNESFTEVYRLGLMESSEGEIPD